MRSVNFEFLRAGSLQIGHELADLGSFAERYVFVDPESSLVKQRKFVELVVDLIYQQFDIKRLYQSSLRDLLDNEMFIKYVPPSVCHMFNTIRLAGNAGAHNNRTVPSARLALDRLAQTYDVARYVICFAKAIQPASSRTLRQRLLRRGPKRQNPTLRHWKSCASPKPSI